MSTAYDRDPSVRRRGAAGRLHVPKTSEVIARWMRKDIHDRRLQPGDPLPSETQLREQFEVSRPTLREAMRILEAQQLVRIARGAAGGARYSLPEVGMVAEHTGIYLEAHRATQHDLTEARLNIEPCVIGFLAEHADREQLGRLRASVAAHREAIPDILRFSRENERFYERMAQICPTQTLGLFLLILRGVGGAQTGLVGEVVGLGEHSRAALEAHVRAKEKLVDLIEARDRPGAEALWRRHVQAQLNELAENGRSNLPLKTY